MKLAAATRAGWWFVGAGAARHRACSSSCRCSPRFALSLTDFDIYALADLRNLRFVGLAQLHRAARRRPLFWKALGNTLYFVARRRAAVDRGRRSAPRCCSTSKLARFKPFFRTALFAPVVTTLVAVAVIWRYLLHTRYGLLNYALGAIGIAPIDWLGDPQLGDAGDHPVRRVEELRLQHDHLPRRPAEHPARSSTKPRASTAPRRWRQFRYVTLPMLAPTLLFVGMLTMAGYFQLFAEPYVMTQGGPLQSTRQRALLHVRGGLQVVEPRQRVRGGLHAVPADLRRDAAAVRRLAAAGAGDDAAARGAIVRQRRSCWALAAIALFPLLWMVSVSFMPPGEASSYPAAAACPPADARATIASCSRSAGMGRYLVNSMLLAVAATLLSLRLQRRWPATRSPSCASPGATGSSSVLLGALVIPGAGGDGAAVPAAEALGLVNTLRRRHRAGAGEHLRHLPRAPVRAVDSRRPARGGAHRRRQRMADLRV